MEFETGMAEPDPPQSTNASISTVGIEDTPVDESLLVRFREDIPIRQANIATALAQTPPDTDTVASEAHRLAGAAAYCGQPALYEAASALERAVRRSNAADMKNAWTVLSGLIDQLLD